MAQPESPGAPVVTVFRSRLRPDGIGEYEARAPEIEALARAAPGFIDFKTFTADDGERLSLVVFADPEVHRAWRDDARHLEAQAAGRDRYYASYEILVCELVATRRFALGAP